MPEIVVDEAVLSRRLSLAARTFSGEIDGATTQEILRFQPRRQDAVQLLQRRSEASALPLPKLRIGELVLHWKAKDSTGRSHSGRASARSDHNELYLTPTGFLCVHCLTFVCAVALSDATYCTMIDPDRGAHQRLYPIARKIPPGDVERFHILIGATKSSRLRLRFKFWVDTSKTVESAVFNVQIHNPLNSHLHRDYVDGEELLRPDAEIGRPKLGRSALKKEAAEPGWLVFDPAGRRYDLTPPGMSGGDGASTDLHESHAAGQALPPTKKHTILFLAGNPFGTDQRALEREARAIQVELERSGCRDGFEFVTRWAVEPLDLLRELRKLKPTVVHFSGSGGEKVAGASAMAGAAGDGPYDEAPSRDVIGASRIDDDEERHGLFFEGPGGYPQLVSTTALEEAFRAAGASVKVVVLNACYSEAQAEALRAHVDCVVGMGGSMCGDATRNFAIGFYGGLGERESVATAFKQGCAAIHLDGLRDADRPRLKVRDGIDPDQLVLAADQRSVAAEHRLDRR